MLVKNMTMRLIYPRRKIKLYLNAVARLTQQVKRTKSRLVRLGNLLELGVWPIRHLSDRTCIAYSFVTVYERTGVPTRLLFGQNASSQRQTPKFKSLLQPQ